MGVSSCLLGENVRYNGEIKLNSIVKFELGKAVSFIPVCPETESGMPVPREPMDLFQTDGRPSSLYSSSPGLRCASGAKM